MKRLLLDKSLIVITRSFSAAWAGAKSRLTPSLDK
jgi:hypothetical protein